MRVAFVHEWLVAHTGSERTLEAMAELFPDAPIHALVWDEAPLAHTRLPRHRVIPSFIQKLPGATRNYQRYLPLMPLAVEQFDLRGYDVVISSSHAVAKGALTTADQLHISYVHTPMRYAWDLYQPYMRTAGRLRSMPARLILHYLRLWDAAADSRVDQHVANSRHVARRITKTYRRHATVIHPPVDVERFRADQPRENFYLVVGRLVPYKRTAMMIEAFNAVGPELGRELVVIGDGPERRRLARLAGPTVRLIGAQPDAVVADHMARCRALLFAAEEDFGIVPVEAQAAGAPVIAPRVGGVRETVVDGATGLLYDALTAEGLAAAIRAFERRMHEGDGFKPGVMRAHAEGFSRAHFQQRFQRFVTCAWRRFREGGHDPNQ